MHILAVPQTKESLAQGFSEVHRRYTRLINFREGWRGYLWEGRFKSYPLSLKHLYAAMRYIETNPVRAQIVKQAWDYPWSSAQSHVFKKEDPLLDDNFVISEIDDWKMFLSYDNKPEQQIFKNHAGSALPLGNKRFIKTIEKLTKRTLKKDHSKTCEFRGHVPNTTFGTCPRN